MNSSNIVSPVMPSGTHTRSDGVQVFKYNPYESVDLQQLAMRIAEPGRLTDTQIQGVITAYSAILARRHQIYAYHAMLQPGTTPYLDQLPSHTPAHMAGPGVSQQLLNQCMPHAIPNAGFNDSFLSDAQFNQMYGLDRSYPLVNPSQGFGASCSQVDQLYDLEQSYPSGSQAMQLSLLQSQMNHIGSQFTLDPQHNLMTPNITPSAELSRKQTMGQEALFGLSGPNLSRQREQQRRESVNTLTAASPATVDNCGPVSPAPIA